MVVVSYRSILNVPWVELGGKVSVTCPKTSYSANIEFHTKVILKSVSFYMCTLYPAGC